MIASPSDVLPEREAVKDVIKAVNHWAIFANIRFESVGWESNTYPASGDYPQDVINNQIGNSYSILVAIFWSKVGTPTQSYPSGTIEEIESALKRRKRVTAMLYFKTAEIPNHILDSDQVEQLKLYKNSLSPEKVFTIGNLVV